jgi:tetratricopeptide (TPR) repeat protein
MTRENGLFGLVGLLFGYAAAFTLVVYLNQSQPPVRSSLSGGQAASGQSSERPMNAVKEQAQIKLQAEQTANQARQQPDNFEAQVAAANASAGARDFEGAIDFLMRANKLRPDDYDVLIKLGNANMETRRFDVAETWLKEAIKLKPNDADARSELALTFFLREPPDVDRAVSQFREALKIQPDHVPSLHNLVLMYIQLGRVTDAEATLAKLERASPENDNLPMLRKELKDAREKKNRES